MSIEKLPLIFPQLILAAGMIIVLVLGVAGASVGQIRARIVWLGLIILASAIFLAGLMPAQGDISGLFQMDSFSRFFLIFAGLAGGLTLAFSSFSLEIEKERFAEFTSLILAICIGISMMAASKNLLLAYLAMETVSLASYVLTGFKRSHLFSHEAALKYVIYGGVASGIMVFGMSLLYGLTGTLSFAGLAQAWADGGLLASAGKIGAFAGLVALVFVFTGFCFKIAAAPFHQWCPDAYQGAPTPFTGFLSVAPKAAGFAMLLRFVLALFPSANIDSRGAVLAIFGLLSALTMTLGNLTAIHQANIKRMLAYSSIAHAGYLLMGLSVFDDAGGSAILLYLVIYLFMNIGAFAVVQLINDRLGSEEIAAYRGLGTRAPLVAVIMAVFLFSLAGLPPLAGFIGKFYLFAALVRNGGFWYIALAIVGILNSVVALFYYTLIIREMFLRPAEKTEPIVFNPLSLALISLTAAPVLILGVYWEPLRQWAMRAVTDLGM